MASDTAIMESLDPLLHDDQEGRFLSTGTVEVVGHCNQMIGSAHSKTSLPDVLSNELTSLKLTGEYYDEKCFPLYDSEERLVLGSDASLAHCLGCDLNANIKVVSIIGNTGEGKSYTMNHTFFKGEEVFQTSNQQQSCTTGVWGSFDPLRQALLLDTEGMLGGSNNHSARTRLLLKVMAVSDIVIYRTRAERLQNDMLYFLGDASTAYTKHFKAELDKHNTENEGSGGPTVIIFHETVHTDPLEDPTEILNQRLGSLNQDVSGLGKLRYVGVRTTSNITNFSILLDTVTRELADSAVRTPRKVSQIYQALLCLNKKFTSAVATEYTSFSDIHFTCQSTCQSCKSRCTKELQHVGEHSTNSEAECIYAAHLENKVYCCKRCQENGRRNLVVPKASSSKEGSWMGLAKFAWSGFVLECQKCGVIYRSRQQWYGNLDPESQGVVHTSVAHVWPGVRSLQGTQNAARRLLDGVTAISGSVSEVSGAPAISLARWAADQVAPAYWRPNADIINCHNCSTRFSATSSIHHCRACGEGFCDACSNFQRPVPEKGWGFQPVRVCKICYMVGGEDNAHNFQQAQPKEVQARRVGETVLGTVTSLATTLEVPISLIKDSARPEYWVPDNEISSCSVCDRKIGANAPASQAGTSVHHCRQCGQGVCNGCSLTRRPVPSRGWDDPVRICDDCIMMPE